MPGATATPEIELIIENTGGGGGTPPAPPGGDGGGGGNENDSNRRRPRVPSPNRYFTGVILGIVSILMFFVTLAVVFLLRKGNTNEWIPIHLPAVLWLNTIALLVSSTTMELARRRLSQYDLAGFRKMWAATTSLGVLFLIGQLIAWRQLVGQGIYMATNPASSFFYIFTAAHGVHLLGGLGALLYISLRKFENSRLSLPTAAEVTSYYWHFMDGLWVFLLALLYLGK